MPPFDPFPTAPTVPKPGQILQRGVGRFLRSLDFVSVEEFVPKSGLRVDVMALGPKGEIWIVECKSSLVDFRTDSKWQQYLEFCDRFFWAVGPEFPQEVLPEAAGIIMADGYGGEIITWPQETLLAGARRKAQTLKFARHAAIRAQFARDPLFQSEV